MRKFLILIFLITISKFLFAQDTLPRATVALIGNRILISWVNPYVYITTINIQRSNDSLKNFTTIGSVLDVKNKKNGFVDNLAGTSKMFYRVFLSFEGGTYVFSKAYRPYSDTSAALTDLKDLKQSTVSTWFTPSKWVYTGRDNNVIISLPNALKKKYAVKFFEESGSMVFELNKITEPYLTVEKVNFVHAGLFNFELYEDGVLIERHKFYIPKDGKINPSLNEQGKNPK